MKLFTHYRYVSYFLMSFAENQPQKMLWIGNNIRLNVDSILCIWNDNLTLTPILQKNAPYDFLTRKYRHLAITSKKISCVLDRCIKVKN